MTLPELVAGADGFAMARGTEVDAKDYITRAELQAWEDEHRRTGLIKD